jgi:hypothetical protein
MEVYPFLSEFIQVYFIAHGGGESSERFSRVVLAAVETAINDVLHR